MREDGKTVTDHHGDDVTTHGQPYRPKMTKLSSYLLLFLMFSTGEAWTAFKQQQQPLRKAVATAVVSAAAFLMVASPLVTTLPAQAVDFSGSYSDPKHPNCLRQVQVTKSSGTTATVARVSGTDGTPGCPADGSGRPWKLVGQIVGSGDEILVDFSPKGGPANLQGKWEATPIPGIRWPDGNLWSIIESPDAAFAAAEL